MKNPNVLLGALTLASLVSFTALAQLQLQPLWSLDPGSRAYLSTDNTQRGIAYNPLTGNLLLVNRTGGLSVNVMDGTTGADKGSLKVTGISGGTLALSQIAVASDGAIYAANLVSPSSGASPFRVYRWADENASPVLVYSGELASGTRWGDNIDIRGSGNNTQILFGEGAAGVGNHIAVFHTADNGATFSPTTMTVSGATAGDTRGGVAFALAGDSFYTKDAGGISLYYGTFNLATASAVAAATAPLPAGLSGFGPLGTYGPGAALAAIQFNSAPTPDSGPQNLYLFDVSNPMNPVTLDIQPFLDPGNQNVNGFGAVDFGGGKVFALNANNGLRAYDLIPEPHEYALLGLGLAVMLWWRRQQQRQSIKS